MVLFTLRSHQILKRGGKLQITSIKNGTWEEYLLQGNGVKFVEFSFEINYRIRLEHKMKIYPLLINHLLQSFLITSLLLLILIFQDSTL
jgi:hypothetical protein